MTRQEDDIVAGVLSAILRGATDVDEIAASTGADPAEIAAATSSLASEGRIAREGDRLLARSPVDHLRSVVDVQLQSIVGAGESIRDRLDTMPQLLNDWAIGRQKSGGEYPVEVLQGPHVLQELWSGRFGWELPGKIRIMTNGLELIESFRVPDVALADSFMSEHSLDVRCLLPGSTLAEAGAERVGALIAPSTQIRIARSTSEWFVLHDDTLALPTSSDQDTFERVLLVTAPPIARLAAHYFDTVWQHSQPFPSPENDWRALLPLLAGGVTIESAARTLGISERTARRRVALAMDHYGVDGLFALGMAWHSDSAR